MFFDVEETTKILRAPGGAEYGDPMIGKGQKDRNSTPSIFCEIHSLPLEVKVNQLDSI